MDQADQRVEELFPNLAAELVELLVTEGEQDLAGSIPDLRFHESCSCGDDFCKSFRTAPRPDGAYGAGHRCVPLLPVKGMLILDVVDDQIRFVEVLDRDALS